MGAPLGLAGPGVGLGLVVPRPLAGLCWSLSFDGVGLGLGLLCVRQRSGLALELQLEVLAKAGLVGEHERGGVACPLEGALGLPLGLSLGLAGPGCGVVLGLCLARGATVQGLATTLKLLLVLW